MSDLIRREDVTSLLAEHFAGLKDDLNIPLSFFPNPIDYFRGLINQIPTAEPTIDDIAERISNTDWYHIFKGELRQGAHDREEALFKAEDIFNILKDMGASEEYTD